MHSPTLLSHIFCTSRTQRTPAAKCSVCTMQIYQRRRRRPKTSWPGPITCPVCPSVGARLSCTDPPVSRLAVDLATELKKINRLPVLTPEAPHLSRAIWCRRKIHSVV